MSVPDVKPGPRLPQLDGVLVAVPDRARAERQPAPRIATEMSPPPRRDAELLAEPNVWSRAVGTGPYRRGLDLSTGITPADVVRATAGSPGMPPVVVACRMSRAADPPASVTQTYHLEILMSVAVAENARGRLTRC